MTDHIDTLAEALAEELVDDMEVERGWTRLTRKYAERVIANGLRQLPRPYAVHRVVKGKVQAWPCGVAVVRKVQP